MSKATVQQISVPDTEWRELLKLSAQEGIPPENLLQNALRRYLSEVRRIAEARRLLRQSFGVWNSRDDLGGDSVDVVNKLREEWDERTKRLGID
jgi:hypothetical protein